MAIIEGSTATLTSPALSRYARTASRRRPSISKLTSTQSPFERLRTDNSLRSAKRVTRAPSSRTQNSPLSRSALDTSTPNRLQLVPRASKWCAWTAVLGRIGRCDGLHVPLPDARRDRDPTHLPALLRCKHGRLQRRRWILQMRGYVHG